MDKQCIKNKINRFKLFYIFSRIQLFTPIFVIFYMNKGLSMGEITLLKSITLITSIVLDVPSGILADIVKKKHILFLSRAALVLSCLVNVVADNFSYLTISAVFWGIGMSLISGADMAWLYNVLKANGMENEYTKINGNLSFLAQIINSTFLLGTSYLFSLNNNIPYLINAVFFLIASVSALFLQDDIQIEADERYDKTYLIFKKRLQEYINNFKVGINENVRNAYIFALLCFQIIFMSLTIVMFDTYQIYLKQIGVKVEYYGPIFFVFVFLSAYASKNAHIVEKKTVNRIMTLTIILVLQGASIVLLSVINNLFGIVLMAFQEAMFGLMMVLICSFSNNYIESFQRTTVLSFFSFATNIVKSIIFPVVGAAIDAKSLNISYIIMGTSMIGFSIFINIITKIQLKTQLTVEQKKSTRG